MLKRQPSPSQAGFTLVEVLVALVILALMALMAWRALDALISTREVAQSHLDGTMRLQTVLEQFERDVQAAQDSGVTPGLAFDGASLRITRRQTEGLQLIAWTLRSGRLYRWAGPTVQRQDELRENVLQSYQQNENDARLIATLDGITDWQMYFFRGTAWTNAQSSADTQAAEQPANAASGPVATPAVTSSSLPTGLRVVLSFKDPGGKLSKTVLLGARP
ncbi:prepilin-type N-terminal cleavage/methylation domain-containing protein [Burkholderiaceae bacterium UC74_6]